MVRAIWKPYQDLPDGGEILVCLGSDPGIAVQSRHEEIRYIFSAERHMSWHESDIVLNVHERGKDFID